jgi:hypothetical protein
MPVVSAGACSCCIAQVLMSCVGSRVAAPVQFQTPRAPTPLLIDTYTPCLLTSSVLHVPPPPPLPTHPTSTLPLPWDTGGCNCSIVRVPVSCAGWRLRDCPPCTHCTGIQQQVLTHSGQRQHRGCLCRCDNYGTKGGESVLLHCLGPCALGGSGGYGWWSW